MKIPLVCETETCVNRWKIVEVIREISPTYLDAFFESYDGSDEDNYCPLCNELAIAYDALPENATVRIGESIYEDSSASELGLAVWLGLKR